VRPFSPPRLEIDPHEAAGPYSAGRQPVELPPEPGYRLEGNVDQSWANSKSSTMKC